MPDRAHHHPVDPELLPGARNAIDTCLRLKPQERITIITDTVTRGIAGALQSEVERVGSDYSLFVLEHHARRPLKYMPEIILDDLALSQVSIFAAQSQPGEISARTQMTNVINRHRMIGSDIKRGLRLHRALVDNIRVANGYLNRRKVSSREREARDLRTHNPK